MEGSRVLAIIVLNPCVCPVVVVRYPDEKDGGNAPQVFVASAAEDEDDTKFHDASDDRKTLLSRLCDYGAVKKIYRIKLPGSPIEIGEGKPANQNHAIIFTRGEALRTIDMNQDNYLEEAFKMRNVLEELLKIHHGRQKPTILGLREHIFTRSVSSLAWFMSNQETSFVTTNFGELSKAIESLGEIYERVEESKQRQMIKLEKQRIQFAKDLEIQRMKLFMDSQIQIEKMKRARGTSEADSYL
ncbi:putative callose synthase 6 [Camellia lanceoleosa]|uniref:Callose synthase 6 n=1 Tax=Camellia lanceoleosa TaxID=1840588 RepID=A0ACC0GG29_9ERIC|nr:putative callose synthase 6 [Camellia lanceoleosa]